MAKKATNDTEYKMRKRTFFFLFVFFFSESRKYPVDSSKLFTAAFFSIKSFVRKKRVRQKHPVFL